MRGPRELRWRGSGVDARGKDDLRGRRAAAQPERIESLGGASECPQYASRGRARAHHEWEWVNCRIKRFRGWQEAGYSATYATTECVRHPTRGSQYAALYSAATHSRRMV